MDSMGAEAHDAEQRPSDQGYISSHRRLLQSTEDEPGFVESGDDGAGQLRRVDHGLFLQSGELFVRVGQYRPRATSPA